MVNIKEHFENWKREQKEEHAYKKILEKQAKVEKRQAYAESYKEAVRKKAYADAQAKVNRPSLAQQAGKFMGGLSSSQAPRGRVKQYKQPNYFGGSGSSLTTGFGGTGSGLNVGFGMSSKPKVRVRKHKKRSTGKTITIKL